MGCFSKEALLKKKGISLIAALMLIVFVSIAVLGVTTFIIQRLLQLQARGIKTGCIYLAQAGIQNATYNFRFHDLTANGYFSLGRTDIDTNNFFVVNGTSADLLMVNTSQAVLANSNRNVVNLSIQNANNSRSITIARMVVAWNNSRRLQIIRINNTTVWSGSLLSPANANISDFTLNTIPAIYPINYLRFSGSMAGTTISIQFIMTDGSTRSLTVYPASNNYTVTVKSTGKTIGSNIYRTIYADYNALTGRIVRYNENNTEITP